MRCENVGNLVTSFPKKNADTFDLPGNDIFLIIVSDASFFFRVPDILSHFYCFPPERKNSNEQRGSVSGLRFFDHLVENS